MPARIDCNSPSPNKDENKVLDGRVQKSKTRKGEAKAPNYRIDGRTFACEGCKNGHRVSRCTHAKDRPLHMTHDPGRPSGDEKRRCECPKQCSCTVKTCKCERNCTCTQIMYRLVYVPLEKGERNAEAEKGEWKIGTQIITDLKGNTLSDEDIKARNELRAQQKSAKHTLGLGKGDSAQSNMERAQTTILPSPVDSPMKPIKDDRMQHECCRHRMKLKTDSMGADYKLGTATANVKKCNCGPGCKCAFCLDHPNNKTSQQIVQQQAAQFDHLFQTPMMIPDIRQAQSLISANAPGSCMGTTPQFRWSSTPNLSSAQLQQAFGHTGQNSGGYYLQYPVEGRFSSQIQDTFDPAALPSSFPLYQTPLQNHSLIQSFEEFLPFSQEVTSSLPANVQQQITSPDSVGLAPDLDESLLVSHHTILQGSVLGFHGSGNDRIFPSNDGIDSDENPSWASGNASTDGSIGTFIGNLDDNNGSQQLAGLMGEITNETNLETGSFSFPSVQPPTPRNGSGSTNQLTHNSSSSENPFNVSSMDNLPISHFPASDQAGGHDVRLDPDVYQFSPIIQGTIDLYSVANPSQDLSYFNESSSFRGHPSDTNLLPAR